MIKLYTIGFTQKSAEKFFNLMRKDGVKKIIDIRINTTSQLSGFAKGPDLEFFAREIGNIGYEYNLDFAPSKDLFTRWRAKILTWQQYQTEYINLLENRKVAEKIGIEKLDMNCFLCSEKEPDFCHRRLLAEYLQKIKGGIEIVHLI